MCDLEQTLIVCYSLYLCFFFFFFMWSVSQSSLSHEALCEKEKSRITVSNSFFSSLIFTIMFSNVIIVWFSWLMHFLSRKIYDSIGFPFIGWAGRFFNGLLTSDSWFRTFDFSGRNNWMLRLRLLIRRSPTSLSSRKRGNGRCVTIPFFLLD